MNKIKDYNDDNLVYGSYWILKCTASYDTCSTILPGGNKGFGFKDVILGSGTNQFMTSIYPSDRLLDFILAFYSGPTGTYEN